MKYIFQYPDCHGRSGHLLRAGPVHEVARTADECGWHGFAFTEHPAPSLRWLDAGGHQSLDPFVALASCAAVTTRIRLLTFLSVVSYRSVFVLGKAAATLDLVSDGRFVLGLGTGYLKSEFRAVGADFERRNGDMDDALEVLPGYWSGEPVDFDGEHVQARQVVGLPPAVQQPIPIWLGGNSGVTRRRVATRADGWMPLVGPPEMASTARTPAMTDGEIARAIAEIKSAAGERAGALDFVLVITDPNLAESECDLGATEARVAELEAVGATWVVVQTSSRDPVHTMEFVRRFAGRFIG